jgi:hypothetical protein
MTKEQEIKTGKPWEIYGTFKTFEAADETRNSLRSNWDKDKIEGMQVKVKRMSSGLFKVKTRIAPEFNLGGGNTDEKNTNSRKRNSKKRKAKVSKASI